MAKSVNILELLKVKTLGIIRNGNKILVARYHNPIDDSYFYRPLGGRIQHGENSPRALVREFKEELNEEITVGDILGVLENVYHYKNKISHEIMFLYRAFVRDELYAKDQIIAFEETSNNKFCVMWKPISDFISDGLVLKPDGLLDLIFEKHVFEPKKYNYEYKMHGKYNIVNDQDALLHFICEKNE